MKVIELPIEVGETVYFLKDCEIKSSVVTSILISDDYKPVISTRDFLTFCVDDIGKKFFTSYGEALVQKQIQQSCRYCNHCLHDFENDKNLCIQKYSAGYSITVEIKDIEKGCADVWRNR